MLDSQRFSLDNLSRGLRLIAFSAFFFALLFTVTAPRTPGQSQALNGQIEGTVMDANGAAIPNAAITATNIETGTERKVTSDESGVYRVPLLPLGTYRVTVEALNFKRLVREGITLVTGQTATVALELEAGQVSEVVTVSGDAPIADPGKIDVGRVMNEIEVRNLPLVSRNPYNFGLLQANVTGRGNSEFGVPRINANGYGRRTNYQLDGNNNTQADRAGIRLMPISEVFVSEVQLVTNGFAPEFGNTPGIIFNSVTPSGTNDIHGSASYRFRRTPFSSRPFNLLGTSPKPPTKVNDFAGSVGGPIIRDRWHFYTGAEKVTRDLSGARVVTISPANRAALINAGLSEGILPGVIPATQGVKFFIVRTDVQISDEHRAVARYNLFRNTSPDNIGGGLNTLERSIDFVDASDSVGFQFISVFSPTLLNEARYQYARRNSQFLPNANSGTGPTIVINGIANFGAPEDRNTLSPLEVSNQLLDNVTVTSGQHTMKFGGGFNVIDNERIANVFARYTFPTVAAYTAARNGSNPLSYTNYTEVLGDPAIKYRSVFYQFFAQDDWKVTPKLKINYGLRYDLYDVPQADPNAPLEFSRDFKIDKNNFAPRLGIVYALRGGDLPTVARFSAGLYYEPPFVDIYRRGIQNNGNPRLANFSVGPTGTGAPRFPNTLGTLPGGSALLPPATIEAVAPDYENLTAFHTNLQIEQALAQNLSLTFGLINSHGSHIPIYRNINLINPIGTLADGRPVFSSAVNASTRRIPQFNNILMVEAAGNSNYTAGTLSLNKRFSSGYLFNVNYTYSHSIDDAPEQNLVAATNFVLSDPTDRRRDRGNSLADQRHTFVLSFVGRPTFNLENKFLRHLLNDNQVGITSTANNGEVFNISANQDVNRDNFGSGNSDRPLFIGRNVGRTPPQYNTDLRYSRFVRFSERYNAEIFGEFINVFNRKSIVGVNSVVAVEAVTIGANGQVSNPGTAGRLLAPLPDFSRLATETLDSRQFQLGFKFNF